MSGRGCRFEPETTQAARTGRWTEVLRAHAGDCPTCRQVVLVTAALASVSTEAPVRPVDPHVIWARARQRRRLRAEVLASRIVTSAQVVAGIILLAGLFFVAARVDVWIPSTSSLQVNVSTGFIGLLLLALGGIAAGLAGGVALTRIARRV
jgi:hypothetical protein